MDEKLGSFYFEGTNNLGILLCHGLTGAPDEMKELGRYLNKLGYTVSGPEYRGHGTDVANFLETSVQDWFSDLEKAFEELSSKVKGVYVMGLSMGGCFTVKLAEERDILGLVTMNAPLIGLPLKEEFDNLIEIDSDMDHIHKYQKYRSGYNKFVVETGQIHNLKKVTAPLLVIQGELDIDRYKISSSMLSEYVSSKYKSRLDFEKSGHLVVLEEERYELFDLIRDFLVELEKLFQ